MGTMITVVVMVIVIVFVGITLIVFCWRRYRRRLRARGGTGEDPSMAFESIEDLTFPPPAPYAPPIADPYAVSGGGIGRYEEPLSPDVEQTQQFYLPPLYGGTPVGFSNPGKNGVDVFPPGGSSPLLPHELDGYPG
jgi:hypothetical protein